MNYSEQRDHPADFEVHYRFYTPEEGGRKSGPPWQHYRSDWSYEGDDPLKDGIFMIWPEFMTESGSIQTEECPVPWTGTAYMWIVNPEMRAEHCRRINIGVGGHFMEGNHRVAAATVIKVIGLHTNPTTMLRKVI